MQPSLRAQVRNIGEAAHAELVWSQYVLTCPAARHPGGSRPPHDKKTAGLSPTLLQADEVLKAIGHDLEDGLEHDNYQEWIVGNHEVLLQGHQYAIHRWDVKVRCTGDAWRGSSVWEQLGDARSSRVERSGQAAGPRL